MTNQVLLSECALDSKALIWQCFHTKSEPRLYRSTLLGTEAVQRLWSPCCVGLEEQFLVSFECLEALVPTCQLCKLPSGLADRRSPCLRAPAPPRPLGGLGPLELRQLIQDAVSKLSFGAIVAPIAQNLEPGTFLRELLAQKVQVRWLTGEPVSILCQHKWERWRPSPAKAQPMKRAADGLPAREDGS